MKLKLSLPSPISKLKFTSSNLTLENSNPLTNSNFLKLASKYDTVATVSLLGASR
jgi:hypothetical protein